MAEVPLLTGKAAEPKEEVAEFIDAKTAFMIYWTKEGEVMVSPDLNAPIVIERPPTATEVYSACAIVQKDVIAQQTSLGTVQTQMQVGRQMAEAQANQQILQQMQKK